MGRKAPPPPEEIRLRAALAAYVKARVAELDNNQSEVARRTGIVANDISAAIGNKNTKKHVSLGMLARLVTGLGPTMPEALAAIGEIYAAQRVAEAKARSSAAARRADVGADERRRHEAQRLREEAQRKQAAKKTDRPDTPRPKGPHPR